MINICTLMRNSEAYIDRFFTQVETELINTQYRIIVGVGDSTDNTSDILVHKMENDGRIHVFDVSHGGKDYGSVINEQRFLQLAYSGNIVWSQSNLMESDVTIWVDSDLILEQYVLLALARNVSDSVDKIFAPTVLMSTKRGPIFYDVWAFRKDGNNFNAKLPYYDYILDKDDNGMFEVDSVGGVVAMHSYIAKHLYFPAKDVFVGFCNQATYYGYRIYLDTSLAAYHE